MAQALASCGSLIHVCALRVTRLDSQGNVVATDNNSYVTNNVTSVEVDPDIEAGLDSTLVGGCDCIIASYKGTDKLKRFNFNLNLPTFEPALLEMMIGAVLIEDTSDIPVPIGIGWPNQLSCDDVQQPNVAVEWWGDLWTDDAPDPEWPYFHAIYPASRWQIGRQVAQNDFAQPQLTGFTRTNTLFGNPYGDLPAPVAADFLDQGGIFLTTTAPPTAECGYQTVVPGT